jgi:hypothetical protein
MGPLLPDEFNPETFPMLRVLPGLVVRTLRKHFYAGVKEAEVRFRYHRADEDAVTGALGERLIEPELERAWRVRNTDPSLDCKTRYPSNYRLGASCRPLGERRAFPDGRTV